MSTALFVVAATFGFLTLVSLVVGLTAMVRGGEFNFEAGNRMMRARVLFQALTLLALFAAFAA